MSDGPWNVFIQSGGCVSFLKDLTEQDARNILQRITRGSDPWTVQRLIVHATGRSSYSVGAGGFGYAQSSNQQPVYTDWWGPPGETLEIWPKPADWDERVEKMKAAQALADKTNAEIAKQTA